MLKKCLPELWLAPPIFRDEAVKMLQDNDIRWIANMSNIDNTSLLIGGGFRFHISCFRDNGYDPGPIVWEPLRTFLLEWLASGEKLAIHCIGGPRRSAAAAYMALRLKGLTDEETRAFLPLTEAGKGSNLCYCGHVNEFLFARENT